MKVFLRIKNISQNVQSEIMALQLEEEDKVKECIKIIRAENGTGTPMLVYVNDEGKIVRKNVYGFFGNKKVEQWISDNYRRNFQDLLGITLNFKAEVECPFKVNLQYGDQTFEKVIPLHLGESILEINTDDLIKQVRSSIEEEKQSDDAGLVARVKSTVYTFHFLLYYILR